jgi:hypothetical protein
MSIGLVLASDPRLVLRGAPTEPLQPTLEVTESFTDCPQLADHCLDRLGLVSNLCLDRADVARKKSFRDGAGQDRDEADPNEHHDDRDQPMPIDDDASITTTGMTSSAATTTGASKTRATLWLSTR